MHSTQLYSAFSFLFSFFLFPQIENKQSKPTHQHLWHLTQQTSSAPPPPPPSSSHSPLEQTRCRQLQSQINPTEKQLLLPKQSASISESSEKDEVRQTTSLAAPQTSFERSPAAISINATTPSKSTAAMIDTQAASNQHFRIGDSFPLHTDNRESSLEDELRNINSSVPYGSSVRTQLYARSLTPTIMSTSSRQSESRPDYFDFRLSPSIISRPRSAMGLTNWTDNYDDSSKMEPIMRSSNSMSKMSSTDQQERYSNRYENLDSEALQKPRQNITSDMFGTPQRKQATALEEASRNVNCSQQPSLQVAKQHEDDGTYSFKKVIITKDGDGAKIQTVPFSIEKTINLQSSSFTANTNVPAFKQPFLLDTTNIERQEKTEIKKEECLNSDWKSVRPPPIPPPPPLNSPPSSPLFKIEDFREIKATEEAALAPILGSKQTPKRKLISRQVAIDLSSPKKEPPNDNVSAESKTQEAMVQDPEVTDVPNGDALCDNPQPNLGAASVTSKKIDILCIEIGELKKKVMAMETGRTYLTALNRTFQSSIDSDTKNPKSNKEDQLKKELEQNPAGKAVDTNQDISERMNQTWTPITNKLFDLEAEFGVNDVRSTSLHSLSFNSSFTQSEYPQEISFQNDKNAPSKTSQVNAVSEKSLQNNKYHLWRVGNRRENVGMTQGTPPFIDQAETVKTVNISPISTLVKEPPTQETEKVDQCVSADKNQGNEEPTETNKKASLENDFADNDEDNDNKSDSPSLKNPPKASVGLVNGRGEVDELLSRYASRGNLNLDWMFTLMKQLKQENEKLKSRLHQEMVKLQMLRKHLQEVYRMREEDAERVLFEEQEVQEEQSLLHQENVELRQRLHEAEELNTELKSVSSYLISSNQRRRKWNERFEFKSWTRLFAFHFVPLLLGKASIYLFSTSTMGKMGGRQGSSALIKQPV